jgi:hypothetical protein
MPPAASQRARSCLVFILGSWLRLNRGTAAGLVAWRIVQRILCLGVPCLSASAASFSSSPQRNAAPPPTVASPCAGATQKLHVQRAVVLAPLASAPRCAPLLRPRRPRHLELPAYL